MPPIFVLIVPTKMFYSKQKYSE